MLIALLTTVSVAYAGDEAQDQKIRALIDKLVFSEQPASKEPSAFFNISINDPWTQVQKAANELEKFGIAAFPELIAHFDDPRQSIAFRRVLEHTVGLACYSIVQGQVYALPREYYDNSSFSRKGADGKFHDQPLWSKQIWGGDPRKSPPCLV
jgi:hypothetical protein